jgi:hypothetical protein
MKKLLPKRKPERKPSDEEFALRKSESPGTGGECGFLVTRSAWGMEGWSAAFQWLQAEAEVVARQAGSVCVAVGSPCMFFSFVKLCRSYPTWFCPRLIWETGPRLCYRLGEVSPALPFPAWP